MPSDQTLTDKYGRPLHGRPLDVARAAQLRRLEAERAELAEQQRRLDRQAAVNRDLARALIVMAVRQTSLPAPDALAALAGTVMGTALEFDPASILTAARVRPAGPPGGYRPGELGGRPAAQQSRTSSMFAASPEHDPRVLEAIRRGGDAEISRVLTEVVQEYGQRAAERQVRREPEVMWMTRTGPLRESASAPLGASVGQLGEPVQRSVVHESVAPLGSEEV
jgi:hypothetical protein